VPPRNPSLLSYSGNVISVFIPGEAVSKIPPPNTFLQPPPIFAMSSYIIPSMAQKDSHRDRDGGQVGVITRTETKTKTKKPSLYKVLLLNDDYTPMEFVVLVLQRYFSMDLEDATRVMLQVHQQGVAVCGVFTYEVAETKVSQVIDFARENQHPLQATLEKA
jgi:ATP-dependent Clp protease adaptor protein ClpS